MCVCVKGVVVVVVVVVCDVDLRRWGFLVGRVRMFCFRSVDG